MHLNPHIFLLPKPPTLIIWNYIIHEQFEITQAYAIRLLSLIEQMSLFDPANPIDIELQKNNIILEQLPPPDNWGWDDLSKLFHLGTKDLFSESLPNSTEAWAEQYFSNCQEVMSHAYPAPHRLNHLSPKNLLILPPPLPNKALSGSNRFEQTLLGRKTSRAFLDKSISLNDVSTLLYLSLGYLKERELDTSDLTPPMFRPRRTSPSGGGLNASEGYLYAHNIQGLAPGIYYYLPQHHALIWIGETEELLGSLLQGQHFSDSIPFGLFITSRFDKMWWKYQHSQAYRVALLEAGHISQTFQLVATALGFKTWLTAALTEKKIEKALGLDDLSEQVLLFVGGGHSNGEAFCEAFTKLLSD